MQSFESMQEMMSMLEMMKELFPQDAAGSEGGGIPGMGDIDVTQLLNILGGGNMPDLSGMSDIMNLFNTSQKTNATDN